MKPPSRPLTVPRLACLLLVASLATGQGGPGGGAGSPAGTPFDLQQFIDAALKAGNKRVVIPRGCYRVTPRQGVHLSFKNLTNVEIVAGGVEMICTETSRAINFENCRSVCFKGMTIDYDPLPFTEGRITALAPDKSWLEFEVIGGYPDNKLEQRIEIYDPATGELRREMPSWQPGFEARGNHRYRLKKHKGYGYREPWDSEQLGDILVTNQRSPTGTGDHAIVADHCTNLRLEEVTLYSAPCFGFLERRCDGTTYDRCKIDRHPPAGDPVPRGFPRMRSLNADAFHSNGATKGPAIIQCTAKHQGDDCVNIHGTYHLVMAGHENELRVLVAAGGSMTIEVGDAVEFLPYEGPRPADAVAVAIQPDAPLTDTERAFVAKLQMYASLHQRLLSLQARLFKVTLDRAVPLPMGSGVCSGNRVGNGCVVKGCDFGYNRSRGIIIKASHAKVIGNTITRSWMTAVLVAPEFPWWHEAASGSDVLVEGNQIVGCRGPAIEVTAIGGNGKPLPSGAHRNIVISRNAISQSVWPNLHVTSTAGLVIKQNRLTSADPKQFVPPLPERWDWGTNPPGPVLVESCDDPKVQATPVKRH